MRFAGRQMALSSSVTACTEAFAPRGFSLVLDSSSYADATEQAEAG